MMTNYFAFGLQWSDDALYAGGVAEPYKILFIYCRQQAMQAASSPLTARLQSIPQHQRHRQDDSQDDTWQTLGGAVINVLERLSRKWGA